MVVGIVPTGLPKTFSVLNMFWILCVRESVVAVIDGPIDEPIADPPRSAVLYCVFNGVLTAMLTPGVKVVLM